MTENESQSNERERIESDGDGARDRGGRGFLIRFLVLALPTGLLLMGLGSVLLTQFGTDAPERDPNEAIRMEAAALGRKPVNAGDLERYLEVLSGTIGERNLGAPESLEGAAVWIESTLSGGNIGYTVERHVYSVDGTEVRNLIAELPGTKRRDEIVVIGAHYDTVPGSPGANDNGTGVAALLALARAFAGDPQERTVRFAAFVNEEPPYFQTEDMGSFVYARRCRGRKEKIAGMLALDTIGYFVDTAGSQRLPEGADDSFPVRGDFLAFVANEDSRFLADRAETAFQAASSVPAVTGVFGEGVPEAGWSDHWSFWQFGYPAVLATDTAPFRYPHYHRATDTAGRIDLERFTKAVKGLEGVIRAWANP